MWQISRVGWDDEFGCEVCEYFDPFGSGRHAISSKREALKWLLRTRNMLVVGERVVIVEGATPTVASFEPRAEQSAGLPDARGARESGIAIVFGERNPKHKGFGQPRRYEAYKARAHAARVLCAPPGHG